MLFKTCITYLHRIVSSLVPALQVGFYDSYIFFLQIIFILLSYFFKKVRGFRTIYLFGHLEMNDYLLCRSIFQGLTRKIGSTFCYKDIPVKIVMDTNE